MLSKEYLLFLVSFFHSVDEAIFGLIDSTTSIPKFDDWVGCYLDNCFVLWLNDGCVWKQQKAWDEIHHYGTCHPPLKVGDCVRMEVDMDSKPQTVQFFVNGEAGQHYVSDLPTRPSCGSLLFFFPLSVYWFL
ncbi:hypothetical protein BLNAU_20017 [Blattamonas nauphoetae]|uniref:B30.2/SPRY domain-containing protein n=1 Tax=Blattamonas nauphoetae TaxID=2049346 RepID=A0ABQ9X2A6_9EUKA|nr:hypothetical protein BLNAU_20017 [Blattamonas nauphoetae]